MSLSRSLALVLLAACAPRAVAPPPTPVDAAPPAPVLPEYAKALVAAMDPKADACQDFYRYACGGWMDATPLPSDKPLWGKSFSTIRDANLSVQKATLEKAAANPTAGDADWAKMGTFYGACMDEAAVDATATAALVPYLAEIDAAKDLKGTMRVAGRLSTVGVPAFVAGGVFNDFKDPTKNILHLTEGGLGLPDRDYYLKTDDATKALLVAYEAHVAEMLVVAGVPAADAPKQAKAVVTLETAIAEAWVPRAELRDPEKVYNKIDRAGLVKLTPKLHWDQWLAGAGAPDATDINVETPGVYKKLEGLLVKTDVKTLRAYLKWHLAHATAPYMGKATYDAHFAFYGQKVTGQKEQEPRWKRCVAASDALIGELTGKSFVESQFAGDSKEKSLTMIKDIETAFEKGLAGLSWMDDPTRARAVEKMTKINNKIGYPDVWRDYSALTLTPGAHTANVLAALAFESARTSAKIGKPVSKGEWYMSPPTVNAYYDPSMNEMAFPAGILQAPFFDRSYPAVMNYGSIGMVMGHELTHGFDDQGRKFDGDGKMVEWWAPEVSARFEERAACVERQYSGFTVQEGINVNGALTLGENIADIGGYRAAYRAYKAQQAPSANVPGLTDDQLFFVAAAQSWCVVASPEIEKMRALSDPHSPPRYRVNGPLQNLPEFAAAFGCAEGTPMRPANACEVW
ncbi:MAG: M13 family metallopeptidase [Pseudomonadota bacterium]|nr:M13 family metallopeptidase [Pseudomonadota bacterium]